MIKDELIQTLYAVDWYVPYKGWRTAPYAFTDIEQAEEYIRDYIGGAKKRITSFVRSPRDDRYDEY
jgi:hypothetical protein